MASIQNLVVNLVGNASSYIQALQQAASSTLGFQNQVESMAIALTQMLKSLGAVEAFSLFNKKMTESMSIMGELSDSMKRDMQDVALDLSTKWAKAPHVMAESYYFLASAGLEAKDAIAALEPVTKFAVAGAFDTTTAVTLATDAMHALGLAGRTTGETIDNLTRVTDVLVKADSMANATVRQFSESLTREAAASLKLYNKEVEEGVAVLMAYASQGIKGQHAGTVLGRMNRMLAKSAFEAAAAHKELKFNVFDPDTGAMRNYADIIGDLERITKGMSNQQKASTLLQLGFEARVQQSILPLIGLSGQIRKYEDSLKSAGGMTDTVAAKQMNAFANQMTNTWNAVKGLAIEIGGRLAPTIKTLAGVLSGVINVIQKLPEWMKQTAFYIGLAVVGFGALIIIIEGAAIAFGLLGMAMLYAKSIGIAAMFESIVYHVMYLVPNIIALASAYGMLALSMAAAAAIAVMGGVTLAVVLWKKDYDNLNESLKESNRLFGIQNVMRDKQRNQAMTRLDKIADPAQRKQAIESELTKELKNREGMVQAVADLKKEVAALEPTWVSLWQSERAEWNVSKQNLEQAEKALIDHNKHIEELKKKSGEIKISEGFAIDPVAIENFTKFFGKLKEDAAARGFDSQEAYEIDRAKKANLGKDPAIAKQIEEAERLLKLKEAHKLQDDINKTAEKLEKEAYAWGKTATEVEIYELKMRGANEAQLDHVRVLAEQVEQQKRADKEYENLKKRVGEAQKVMEDARTPEEKFIDTTREMGKLLNEGLIGFDDYSHAINKAYKEMEKITKETQKANKETEKMTKIEAAAYRSAEGFARMRQQLEDFNISKSKKVKDPKAEAGKVNLDDQLNQVIKQVIDPVRKNEGKEKPAQEVQNKLLEDIRNILKEQGKNPNAKIAPAGVGQ